MRYVKVSEQKLIELLEAENTLNCLQNGGVNNWDWYEECFDEHDYEEITDLGEHILVLEATDEETLKGIY